MSAVDTAQTGPPMTTRGRDPQKRAEHILHFTGQMLFPIGITNAWYGRRGQALLQSESHQRPSHTEGTLSVATKIWVTGQVSQALVIVM